MSECLYASMCVSAHNLVHKNDRINEAQLKLLVLQKN